MQRLTWQEYKKLVDSQMLVMADFIDKALRTHGKLGLFARNENGVILFEELYTSLQQHYKEEVESNQAVHDYLNDEEVSESDKQHFLLWCQSAPLSRSQAQKVQDNVAIWIYRINARKIFGAMEFCAQEQGLSYNDVYFTLSLDDRKIADYISKEFSLERKPVSSDEANAWLDRLLEED